MQPVLSSAQMREIDRLTVEQHNISSLTLMENAARAVISAVVDCLSGAIADKAVFVLCGPGNNGGDGAAAARGLALMGGRVHVVLFGTLEDTKGDARINFEIVRGLADKSKPSGAGAHPEIDPGTLEDFTGSLQFTECNSTDEWQHFLSSQNPTEETVIVDALFGTGLRRPLQGVQQEVVRFLFRLAGCRKPHNVRIISVDIPSGLNSNLADPIGDAVQAYATVTMTAPKPANVLPPASIFNGKLITANIGSPDRLLESATSQLFLIEESDARKWLWRTRYRPDSYKNTHGHALVIAGSRGFTGAAALCGAAAMRAGAGLVTIASPVSAQPTIAALAQPEIMTAALSETDRGAVSDQALEYALMLAAKANVVAIGPGLSAEDERTRSFVRAFVEQRPCPLVIDADALNALAPWPDGLRGSQRFPIVLTPHQGEMLRLLGTSEKSVLADRVAAARDFAKTHRVILLLKGTRSLIAAPDGRVFVNPTGNAGLGTAGCGDTLTGLVAGFLAQTSGAERNTEPIEAIETVIAALYVGGLAGDLAAQKLGMRAMVASDVREHFSAAIRAIDPEGELP